MAPIDCPVLSFRVLAEVVRFERVLHGTRDLPAVSGLGERGKSCSNRLDFEATGRGVSIKHSARALHTNVAASPCSCCPGIAQD